MLITPRYGHALTWADELLRPQLRKGKPVPYISHLISVSAMVLDSRRAPSMWSKFNAGLEGSAWYLLRMHQQLNHRLPQSRSVERLGESVREILGIESYRRLVPTGLAPAVWAAGYAERQS